MTWEFKEEENLAKYEQGTLDHARAIAHLARNNMDDLIPYVTLPSWVVVKLLDELEK